MEIINRLDFDGFRVAGPCRFFIVYIDLDWRVLIQQIEALHTVKLKTRYEQLVLVSFGLHRSKHLCDNFGKDTPLMLSILVDLGFLLSKDGMGLASARLSICEEHTITPGHTDELIDQRAEGFVNLLLSSFWAENLSWKPVRVFAFGKHVLGVKCD